MRRRVVRVLVRRVVKWASLDAVEGASWPSALEIVTDGARKRSKRRERRSVSLVREGDRE